MTSRINGTTVEEFVESYAGDIDAATRALREYGESQREQAERVHLDRVKGT